MLTLEINFASFTWNNIKLGILKCQVSKINLMVLIRILLVYCYIEESVHTRTFINLLSINFPRIYANNGSTFITKTHFYVDKAMKCASVPCYIGFESNTNTDFIFQDH